MILFYPLEYRVQAALFFGVEALLLKCKTWFAEKTSLRAISSPPIYLDDLIEIWNFALEHGEDSTNYLSAMIKFILFYLCLSVIIMSIYLINEI